MRLAALFLSVLALAGPSFTVRAEPPPRGPRTGASPGGVVKKEDLVLIDGRYLHVKILSENEQGVQVEILETGGKIFLPYGLIDEPYRTEIMKRFGRGAQEEKVYLEDGDHVVMKSGDVYEGRITNETDTDITMKVHGTSVTWPKDQIKTREKQQVNVLEIYKPEEYYKKRAGDLKVPEDDIPGNMELGELAIDLQLFETAYANYKRVQATDPGYEKEKIENILKRLDELQKNKQVRDAMIEAWRLAQFNNFTKSLSQFEALLALKDIPESVRGEIGVYKERAIKLRYEVYRKKVRDTYELKLNEKLRTMSRDEKLTLGAAQKRLRGELHKEIVAELVSSLGLDTKEVEKMWDERNWQGAPRIASYGSGSFIVLGRAPDADKYEQDLQKALNASVQKQNQGKSSKSTGLQAPQDKLPKPPTKEEWWQKVSTSSDKEQWMKAFWAENSKKVTVVGDRREACARCGGSGALSFAGSQGDTLRTTCPSCQGHKYYKGVAFK